MNYIKQLEAENKALKAKLEELNERIISHEAYFSLDKFHGIENDYAHVSTDIQPKLFELKQILNK